MSLSEKYDEFYSSDLKKESFIQINVGAWPLDRVEAIVSIGGEGNRILDIGCGSGMLLFQFRDNFKQLVGLEYSKHRLKQASVNLAEQDFIAVQGSAEHMPEIESNSIDRIVSADTIEHIPNVYTATSEMYLRLNQVASW